jgi:hypothetical protein
LVDLDPAVLLAPAKVPGVREPQQLASRRHHAPTGDLDVRLPKLVGDVRGLESLAWDDLTS